VIEVKNLYAGYGSGDVIRNISFKAARGENLCVLGPNGCGKSTLLKTIARIIDYRGLIEMEGRDIAAFPRKALARKVALLTQVTQVFFPYTVYETISLGRYAYCEGLFKNLSLADKKIIESVMERLDIAGLRDCMINELSGGQLQRVFLARTLAQTPDVILLDEPTNHLDLRYQIELLDFLRGWVKENDKTIIGVFHDLNLAKRFSDAAILMQNGVIAYSGKIEDVLAGKKLQEVYGIDIHAFMRESLARW